MILNEMNRITMVRALLEFSMPLEEIIAQLAVMGWDYDGNGVELTRKHLTVILQRYLDGKLSSSDIEAWANCIEGREDIRFEIGLEQKIEDILYELANPLLTQPLDETRAEAILKKLSTP